MKFKIKHLLILMAIAALALAAFFQPKKIEFRHKTLEDAVELEEHGDWQVLTSFGDQQGPFRKRMTLRLGRNPNGWKIDYMNNGKQQSHLVKSDYQGMNTKVVFFQNRKGNHLCLLLGQP